MQIRSRHIIVTLLLCLMTANCSDLYPNTCVVIQCFNGKQVEFYPVVSLMDGEICPGDNLNVMYDFSNYDMINHEMKNGIN